MADLYEYDNDNGIVIPQTSDLKSQTQAEFQAAFGSNLSLVDSTPQGVLIQNITDLKSNVISANAAMVNGFNIFYARGIQLDAIGLNFGVTRTTNQPTTVKATVYGVENTVILAGSIAQTTNGDNFISSIPVTIGASGEAEVEFISQETGEIPCPIGALSVIVSEIDGWERITNEQAPTLGYDAESDYSYRLRIFREYQKASGFVESYQARLSEVSNVKDELILENYTNASRIIKGIEIPAHSIAAIVLGGTDEEAAEAIFTAKDAGCGYTAITEAYAYGYIKFDSNLSVGDTITINGTTITAGTDFVIGSSLEATLQNIAQGVTISNIALTYGDSGTNQLDITYTTAGTAGNSIAIASSSGVVSNSTLMGGFSQDVSVTESVVDVYNVGNTVIFNRPLESRVAIKVLVKTNTYTGTDLKGEIEQAILTWASNEIEEVEGITIGSNINAWEIASAITVQIPNCQIVSVYIGEATGTQAEGSILFADNLENGDTVTIGSTVLTAGTDFDIGNTLADTLINIVAVGATDNTLSSDDDTLYVEYAYTGTAGNSVALASTATGVTVTAMSGGTDNSTPTDLNVNMGTIVIGSVSVADMDVTVL